MKHIARIGVKFKAVARRSHDLCEAPRRGPALGAFCERDLVAGRPDGTAQYRAVDRWAGGGRRISGLPSSVASPTVAVRALSLRRAPRPGAARRRIRPRPNRVFRRHTAPERTLPTEGLGTTVPRWFHPLKLALSAVVLAATSHPSGRSR